MEVAKEIEQDDFERIRFIVGTGFALGKKETLRNVLQKIDGCISCGEKDVYAIRAAVAAMGDRAE